MASSTLTNIIRSIETLNSNDLIKLQHFLELYVLIEPITVKINHSPGQEPWSERKVFYSTPHREQKKPPRKHVSKTVPKTVSKKEPVKDNLWLWFPPKCKKEPVKNSLDMSLEELIYRNENVNDIIRSEISDWRAQNGDVKCPDRIKKEIRERVWNTRNKYLE